MENYSVLMSVYHRENPEHFATAIESILHQTVVTDDFVIVCDGPLTEELDGVIARYVQAYPDVFNIVRLPENVGIGLAASAGLQRCKNALIAKMDADDIAVPQRCEKQLKLFADNPALAVAGGYIEEFDEDPDVPFAVREVPLTNGQIRKFARRRQPFNNVSVMYRKAAVLAVGGYRNLRRAEDYDLYVRLLKAGCEAANLGEVLVKARVDRGAYARRASWSTLCSCASSRWNAFRIGYSSIIDVLVCVVGEFVILISPPKLQHFLYSCFLRKKCDKNE